MNESKPENFPSTSEEIDLPVLNVEKDYVESTFPSGRISLAEIHDGMSWGQITKPLRFELNADLPSDRLGQTDDRGDHILILIGSKVPNHLKDVIIYHELCEAETLYAKNRENPAPNMEEQYINTFLSDGEKEEFEHLYGKSDKLKAAHKKAEKHE